MPVEPIPCTGPESTGGTVSAPCPAHSVLEPCRCDDTTGDGTPDTEYVELLAIDCSGALSSLGTFRPDLSTPYTPVAPVECDGSNTEPVRTVQAHRVQLDPAGTWSAASVATLQSVTATAHGGTGTITTAEGTTTLFEGESVTWSVAREKDALLTGPLMITAETGAVSVTYTSLA